MSGDGAEHRVQSAVHEAYELLLAHADQADRDRGYTAEEWNLREVPAAEGYQGPHWTPNECQTLYRGVEPKQKKDRAKGGKPAAGSQGTGETATKRITGLAPEDEVQPGELWRRAARVRELEADGLDGGTLLPPTRPDKLLRPPADAAVHTEARQDAEGPRAARLRPRRRCDEIHESDRVLRAKSDLGVLCTPADAPQLDASAVAALYNSALTRLNLHAQQQDAQRLARARQRLTGACQRMQNQACQRAARAAYRAQPWEVTNVLRTPVNIAGLEAFAATPEALAVPTTHRAIAI